MYYVIWVSWKFYDKIPQHCSLKKKRKSKQSLQYHNTRISFLSVLCFCCTFKYCLDALVYILNWTINNIKNKLLKTIREKKTMGAALNKDGEEKNRILKWNTFYIGKNYDNEWGRSEKNVKIHPLCQLSLQ